MMIFFDFLPLIVIAAFVLAFSIKGFIKTLMLFSKTVTAFICAIIFGSAAANLYSSLFVNKMVTDFVYDKLAGFYDSALQAFDLSALFEKINTDFAWIGKFGVDVASLSESYGKMTAAGANELYSLASSISAPMVRLISNLLGYISVFVLVFVLCFVLALLAKGLTKLLDKIPVVGKINHILVGVMGLVYGVVLVLILVYVIDSLMHMTGAFNGSFDYELFLEKSIIFKFIKNINIIQYLKMR